MNKKKTKCVYTFWSIMGKVFSTNYVAKPFLIAICYGNSKPYSAREFLEELVSEANILTNEGIKKYFAKLNLIPLFYSLIRHTCKWKCIKI